MFIGWEEREDYFELGSVNVCIKDVILHAGVPASRTLSWQANID